jgi:hypothetical protein
MEFTNGNIQALPTYLVYKGAFETLKEIVENKRVKQLAENLSVALGQVLISKIVK